MDACMYRMHVCPQQDSISGCLSRCSRAPPRRHSGGVSTFGLEPADAALPSAPGGQWNPRQRPFCRFLRRPKNQKRMHRRLRRTQLPSGVTPMSAGRPDARRDVLPLANTFSGTQNLPAGLRLRGARAIGRTRGLGRSPTCACAGSRPNQQPPAGTAAVALITQRTRSAERQAREAAFLPRASIRARSNATTR
eukprot:362182-Chlamydomonas_euryale.AAC.3